MKKLTVTKHRTLLLTFGLSAVLGATAIPAHSQSHTPRVVYFSYYTSGTIDARLQAFKDGMKELGYEEGRNIVVEHRSGRLSREETERVAKEIIASRPAVIVGQGSSIAVATAVTKTIPVVAAYSGDMVESGVVKSLSHPGGNVTGIQLMMFDLVGKRVELLKELLPNLKHLAVIAAPRHPGEARERDVTIKAAKRLGIRVSYYPAPGYPEFDAALIAAGAAKAEALLIFPDGVSMGRTVQAAVFASQHKLPTVAGWDFFVEDGQLISYGPNLRAAYHRVAYYVSRILKGESPAILPVEQPTVFELVVNLKTARAIGVKIPQTILVRTDRVIK